MANRGQAQYLRLYDGSGTYARFQNYYVNQTISLNSANWEYYPFSASGLSSGAPGTDSDVSVEIPATGRVVDLVDAALRDMYLCELKVYEFDSRLSQTAPQAGQVLIVNFVGEVVAIDGSFTALTIQLGSSLAPVGAQVPPRKFGSKLIGAPIRL